MKNKIIFVFGILSLIFLVLIVSSNIIFHFRHVLALEKEKAWGLAKTIEKSLDLPMVEGEMDTVAEMLVTVGQLSDLKRIHITDSKGIIRYSSIPSRVNTVSESKIIERVLEGKNKIGDFEQRGDDYLFSLALPIINEKRCQPCHNSKSEILGVLRVGIDWKPVQQTLLEVLQKDIVIAFVFYVLIIFISVLFQRFYNNAQQAYVNLEKTQEQLIKAEKMAAIGQMAAAISHDLRNPLTGIKMATYYLGTKIDKSKSELTNILKDIELEIDYASNVVTNILTYSKPTELICTYANINKIIEETIPFLHLQSRDLNIELIKDYAKQMPEILVDVKQIEQVIVNLLTNGIQAMPKGGKLQVITRYIDEHVEIKIVDNGGGINLDERDKIYNPFFTTKARGVGLGLSIVNNIVIRHEGELIMESEVGKGTTFIVQLPLKRETDNIRIGEAPK